MSGTPFGPTARRGGVIVFIAFIILMLKPWPALAQDTGCRISSRANPPRQELRCLDGLKIVAEDGANFRLLDQDRNNRPDAIELTGKALLIDVAKRHRGEFQILTPHAIASVRGTRWAVDVAGGQTSVFVRRGVVAVRRATGAADIVTLRAGDGVDVAPGEEQLQVKRWAPARVKRLLARFGL